MAGNVKAAACINALEVLRRKLEPGELEQIVAATPPATQALLTRKLLPVEWIPWSDWLPLYDVLSRWPEWSPERLSELTKEAAARTFGTIYKVLVRLVTMEAALERVAHIFATLSDVGRLELIESDTRSKPKKVELRLSGFPPFPVYAFALQGYVTQVAEMTGAKHVAVACLRHDVVDHALLAEFRVTYD